MSKKSGDDRKGKKLEGTKTRETAIGTVYERDGAALGSREKVKKKKREKRPGAEACERVNGSG